MDTQKLQHWKKLDHILFLAMGIPILFGFILSVLFADNTYSPLLFAIIGIFWLLVMIVDQLEEHLKS